MGETEQKQNDFLQDLRALTSDSHKNLEQNKLSVALLGGDISVQGYQSYLAKLHGVVHGCESQVYPLLTHLYTDLKRREKSCLIYNDLLYSGMSAKDISRLPVCRFEHLTIAEALGIMYVVEGSTLGGRFLYKHINEKLGYGQESGASYFWGYGTETGSMWKIFLSSFTRFAVAGSCQQEISESAVKTFNIIDNWLSKADVHHHHED